MHKQKIIITIDWFLPGTNSGGPVRSMANMIAHLDEYDFFILTRDTDYCSDKVYPTVTSDTWTKFSENVQVYYFSEDKLNKKNIKRIMSEVNADAVYINGVYSKNFSILPLQIAKVLKLKIIIATRGMLSPHALAVKPLKKKLFLQLANTRSWYKNVVFHATQEQEKLDIQRVIKKCHSIEVIPNFPRKINETEINSLSKEAGAVRFIALGRIAEEKGTLISIEALQKVKGKVNLDLYGTIYNPVYWEKCQQKIASLPEGIEVHYKGNLDTEEVMRTLMCYHFLLLPSKGENFGHSILESFLVNRPVIISKHTPWQDLEDKQMGYDVTEEELPKIIQKVVEMEDEEFQQLVEHIRMQYKNLSKTEEIRGKYLELFN